MSSDLRTNDFSFDDRDKNVRDVIIHLYEWHLLLVKWITTNLNNENNHFLPKEYTWKTYPKMNLKFWEKHQDTSLEDARKLLMKSHESVIALLCTFSNDQLFTKKHYNWTGTTSVGSYCVSATSSHYDWAYKKIKKHKKTL